MKTFLLSNIEYKVIVEYKVILITFGLKNFKAFSFVRDYCILTIQVFNLKYMQYENMMNYSIFKTILYYYYLFDKYVSCVYPKSKC